MTLIQRRAGDGSAGGTDAVLTRIVLCTGVAVAAGRAVGDVRVRTPGRGVARIGGARVAVVAAYGGAARAGAGRVAGFPRGAGIAVVAGSAGRDGSVHAARRRITRIARAGIGVVAAERSATPALAALTGFRPVTDITVGA